MLGLLAGHRRYAHITALRGDAEAAQALGLAKVVSEDAPRLVLDVQVSSGKLHTSGHAKAALGSLLDELGGKAAIRVAAHGAANGRGSVGAGGPPGERRGVSTQGQDPTAALISESLLATWLGAGLS